MSPMPAHPGPAARGQVRASIRADRLRTRPQAIHHRDCRSGSRWMPPAGPLVWTAPSRLLSSSTERAVSRPLRVRAVRALSSHSCQDGPHSAARSFMGSCGVAEAATGRTAPHGGMRTSVVWSAGGGLRAPRCTRQSRACLGRNQPWCGRRLNTGPSAPLEI